MPYPAQIERAGAVAQARQMIEAEGAEALSLHRLAAALGVKAPSLYRYFASKAELLAAVNLETYQGLIGAVQAAVAAEQEPVAQARAMARAYRQFALHNPHIYSLAFSTLQPEERPDPAALEALAVPLQRLMSAISGEADSLAALRGLLALVHGFVMLEIYRQLQRGGSLDQTFEQVVDAYIAGWARQT
jgi:AcrR family transcriptional regulator